MLISVSHQFKAENLIRIIPLPEGFGGPHVDAKQIVYYEYVECDTLERSDGGIMAKWYHELPREPWYRAIDRRTSRRIPAHELPSWLSYK